MGVYRTWEFSGKNNDGSPLTSKQIECLVALNESDLEEFTWEQGGKAFGWGETTSIGAYERIYTTLTEFASLYPEVSMFVSVQVECEPAPFAVFVRGGKVREATGKITYYFDDDGEEVDLNDY